MSSRKISDTGSRGISFAGNAALNSVSNSRKHMKPLPPLIKFVIKVAGYGPQPPVELVPRHIEKFEEDYKFDPSAKPHRDIILDHANENVEATLHDENYQLKKWCYFSICALSSIVGFMLALFSLGLTPVFNSFSTNWTIFYVSCIFYIPFVCWLRVMGFPGKRERSWRKYVLEKRKWRHRLARKRRKVFHGYEGDSDEEGAVDEHGDIESGGVRQQQRQSNSFQGINGNNPRSSFKGAPYTYRSKPARSNSVNKGGKSGKETSTAPSPPPPILQTASRRQSLGGGAGGALTTQASNKRISFQV